MGALYKVIPVATSAPFALIEVATGVALKTLLQVATPSTTNIRVAGWGVSFDGVSPTAAPGLLQLVDVDVAATVTAQTPEKWGNADQQASLCIGGVSATGYNASAEGTITGARTLDGQEVHPQTGYSIWFPELARPLVKASRFLRIRATFAADINGIPWIVIEEPA